MPEPQPEDYSFRLQVPDGDDRQRQVCADCGWIHYVNPKVVVGVVATWRNKFLLCRRAIEPRQGYWTMPAGFMEEGESVEEGTLREAREEVNIEPELTALLAVYSIPHVSQVQIFYKGDLPSADFEPGAETLEAAFFDWDEIPWDELAFPTVRWALKHHRESAGRAVFAPFTRSFQPSV